MSGERPFRPTWAEIDTAAFARNLDRVARELPERARLVAVLKANAYGHGAIEIARVCERGPVAMLAVALLEEALTLRGAGIALPILVFGALDERGVRAAIDHDVTIGVPGPEALEAVCAVARERDFAIHLKLDTGMGRMGATEPELQRVAEMIRATPRLRVDAIYSHFASADEDDAFTRQQMENFDRMLAELRTEGVDAPLHHFANSAATLRHLVRPGDFARVGIALYGPGGVPSDLTGEPPVTTHNPEPVMRWRTEIVRLKTLPRGHAIGYGTTFHTIRESRIATLPVGYADGFNRLQSNNGTVIVRGKRVPIVGRVSMDLLTVDVTDVAETAVGDEVTLLGDGITADEIASRINTISYEVFCSVSARVPRIYR
jgi:alanine racemase